MELNALDDLERQAQEKEARLRGIRKEYGKFLIQQNVRGPFGTTYGRVQQQPQLLYPGRISVMKLGVRKQKMAAFGIQSMRPMSGETLLNPTSMVRSASPGPLLYGATTPV